MFSITKLFFLYDDEANIYRPHVDGSYRASTHWPVHDQGYYYPFDFDTSSFQWAGEMYREPGSTKNALDHRLVQWGVSLPLYYIDGWDTFSKCSNSILVTYEELLFQLWKNDGNCFLTPEDWDRAEQWSTLWSKDFLDLPVSYWSYPYLGALFPELPMPWLYFSYFALHTYLTKWLGYELSLDLPQPVVMPYPWQMSFQMPASPFMDKLDVLHAYIMYFLIFVLGFVLFWMSFLLLSFMHCKFTNLVNSHIVQVQHNSLLEFVWTVVPFAILLVIFSSSAALIYDGANKTNIGETLSMVGNQWYWKYNSLYMHTTNGPYYENDSENYMHLDYDSYLSLDVPWYVVGMPKVSPEKRTHYPLRLLETDGPLLVPAYTWLRFLVSSSDVIHSWALPALGMKCDAVPGRINEVISLVAISGEYFGQCSELCGINHGFMPVQLWAFCPQLS